MALTPLHRIFAKTVAASGDWAYGCRWTRGNTATNTNSVILNRSWICGALLIQRLLKLRLVFARASLPFRVEEFAGKT